MVALKPSEATKESKTARSLAQDLLIQLYDNDMFLVDKNYAETVNNLSKNLLKNTKVQQAASIPLQDLKQGLHDFVHVYPFYRHYNLYNKLVKAFAETIRSFQFLTDHPDAYYIKKLLRKHGYNAIKEKYENEYIRFMSKTILPNFEEFIDKHSAKDYKFAQQFLEWFKQLKECQHFYCYKRLYDSLIDILYTPEEKLLRSVKMGLNDVNIEHVLKAQEIAKSILNDFKISQLNATLKRSLTKDINYFIKQYESDKDLDNLSDILKDFERNISIKYYNNIEIPIKERIFLKNIFDNHGYAKMKEDFIESNLPRIFKKRSGNNELSKGKDLLEWYDYVECLETYQERLKAFDKLPDLKKI